jgi:diguanylate cyclase (GGDEF)-like protein
MEHSHKRAASSPADLFETIHQQAERVLGQTTGFYVAVNDPARERVSLAYLVNRGGQQNRMLRCSSAECDAIRERRTLLNDSFVRKLSDDVATSITVPMIRDGAVLGAFGAFDRTKRVYDERDALALVAIAELAAVALQNAQFMAQLEKARREAERLEEIGRALTASLELSDVLQTVVEAALELTEADSATVWLTRGDHDVEAAMTAGEFAPERGLIMPIPPMLQHDLADLRRAFVSEDLQRGAHELPGHMRNAVSARSTVAVPLVAGDNVLGALSLGNREQRHYSEDDVRLVERLSFQAAIAVSNARMHEKIIAMSMTDPLTRLPNRRRLELHLEKEFAAARRGRRLSVILFDLDNFKQYNDTAGHQAGDEALHEFGEILIAQTRAMNLAARYGGDEFITIIADADRAGALLHAERVAEAVSENGLLVAANIRASAGVGTFDPAMRGPADLIRAADSDLYARKAIRKVIAV